MSRAFVKEGDQEEVPLVAPRAFLPQGVPNYVTPQGLALLQKERVQLIQAQGALKKQEGEHRVQMNYLTAKIQQLDARLGIAQVVENSKLKQEIVRFGAVVTLYQEDENETCQYKIVGVDEADAKENKISFLSPLAKALLNKSQGDGIEVATPNGLRHMKIDKIQYEVAK